MSRVARVSLLLLGIGVASAAAQGDSPAITGVDFVARGASPLETFRYPSTLAVDPNRGIVVVGDTGNHSLLLFDLDGRYRGSVVYEVDAAGVRGAPLAVAVDFRGRLYVIDSTRPEIEIMSSRGSHLGFLPNPIDPRLSRPQDIAVGRDGTIYLLFSGDNPGFLILENSGAVRAKIGFETADASALFGPAAIAVNPDQSRIAVVDPQAKKSIHLYNGDGRLLSHFGRQGEGRDTLSIPVGVTWGAGNTLWVVDTVRHVISVFSDQGEYLGLIGGYGFDPGQMYYPVDCAFAGDGRLAVLERAGARLQLLTVHIPTDWTEGDVSGQTFGFGNSGAGTLTIEEHFP